MDTVKGKRRKGAVVVCDQCGEEVPIGGWAFCRSKRNPEGHSRGTYQFTMRSRMATHKWERRER